MKKWKFEIENLQNKLFNCYVHQQKFNQYALELFSTHWKCSWYTDVIFELIVLTQRSNHKCVPYNFHKAYKCNQCGKLFTCVGYMKRHIKLLQKFQMWILWKIIYSSWFPEQTHKYYSLRSQRFQMWLFWKIFSYLVTCITS